jgi:outer membrane biosynthesis protein TonB
MRGRVALPVLLAVLAAPPAAIAQQEILEDYRRDGVVDPCAYSPGELQQGLENLPPDIEQYAPDLADQLRRGAACAAPAPAPQPEQAPPAEAPAPVAEAPPAAKPKPKPKPIPDPPAPRTERPRVLPGAAPAAATVPTTRAAESDFPSGLLIAAALALGAGLLATRLRRA